MLLLIPVPVLERATRVIYVESLASRRIADTRIVVAFWITSTAVISKRTPVIKSIT